MSYHRFVAMRPPVLVMRDVAFGLKSAQDGEHRGVGQVVFQSIANLSHRAGSMLPQDRHQIRFSFGQFDAHEPPDYPDGENSSAPKQLSTTQLVDTKAARYLRL